MAKPSCSALLIAGVLTVSVAPYVKAAPTQAAAPKPSPLFAAYQRFCLTIRGEPAKALALAAAQGWLAPAPEDRLPLGALSMADGQQREVGPPGARLHLTVGHAADPAGLGLKPTPWGVCIVSSEVADPAAAPALAAWAGVPPTRGSNAGEGATLFVIAQNHDAPRRSAEGLADAEVQALVDRRQIVAVGSNMVGSSTILLYATPAP